MTQDELKALVGQAALQYVTPGEIVGVGTGSTVNKFIDALATIKDQIKGAVSSSVASTARLQLPGQRFRPFACGGMRYHKYAPRLPVNCERLNLVEEFPNRLIWKFPLTLLGLGLFSPAPHQFRIVPEGLGSGCGTGFVKFNTSAFGAYFSMSLRIGKIKPILRAV